MQGALGIGFGEAAEGPTVVVGGGIAGLAAAYFLGEDVFADIIVLEASPQVGGKLRRDLVADLPVDVGAEAMLNRRPEGVELADELGLRVVHPAVAESRIWVDGELRPLPRTLMGAPLDIFDLARSGVLTGDGLARAQQEGALPPSQIGADRSVGDLVEERFGAEVVDRLVEPLLGGVYAGHAREISVRAAVPQLAAYAEQGSILRQAQDLTRTYDTPVFAGIPGGMGLLPEALVDSARFEVRTRTPVRALRRTADGFEVELGRPAEESSISATKVVLATPAAVSARLLSEISPRAGTAELAAIESASVAVVTFAFRAMDLPELPGSGLLVPPGEGRRIKAATFSANKWDWVRDLGVGAAGNQDLIYLRTSIGRHRDTDLAQAGDQELIATSLLELGDAVGVTALPVDAHVQRWEAGLPQYAVGHLDRVLRIREAVAQVPGLSVCGAAYDGVGIPSVIASARRATMAP